MSKQRSFSTFLASATLALVVSLPAAAQLPAGFTARDIGEPGAAGSTTVVDGKFSIKGAGADLWGNDSDHFQFVSKEVTGDGNITARLLGTTGGHVEDGWEKVGAMIREDFDQDSAHATTYMSNRNGGVYFMWREAKAEATQEKAGFAQRRFPIWLRTQRQGNEFTGYFSLDGQLWSPTITRTVTMGAKANFGLHEMSHEDGVLSTSEWDNVAVNAGQIQITGLQACANANGVLLTWRPLAGAASYNVLRGPAGADLASIKMDQLAKINTDSVAQASYSDTGDSLAAGARHVYAVAPVMADGTQGPLTAVTSGKVGPPTPPAGFTFTAFGQHKEGDCETGSIGVSQDANGVITLRGGGFDLWDSTDHAVFLHQKVAGNFRASVTLLDAPLAITLATKGGLMVREDLSGGGRHVMATLRADGVRTQFRTEKAGDVSEGDFVIDWMGVRDQLAKGGPIHLRVTRNGATITTEYSLDGTTFQAINDPVELAGLTSEVEVGIGLTARDRDEPILNRITEMRFRDLKIEKL